MNNAVVQMYHCIAQSIPIARTQTRWSAVSVMNTPRMRNCPEDWGSEGVVHSRVAGARRVAGEHRRGRWDSPMALEALLVVEELQHNKS